MSATDIARQRRDAVGAEGSSSRGAADGHPPRYADAARDLLRGRVLDAVGELLRDHRWAEVTMADVAERAGVSRQTLYNAFGSRPELAQAYVLREAEGFLGAVDDAVRSHAGDPQGALSSALEIFLSAAETNPLIRAITSTDGNEELLPLVTTRGGQLIDQVTDHLTELLIDTWPPLTADDARLVADALVRLAISYAALPSGPPRQTADAIARILGPSIDQLLGPVAAKEP